LRKANRGLLFLDEIGELGADEQAMLLRALEEKRFFPYGGDKEISSDFQLIAGTNRDLISDVERGRFREDLLARINLWTFELPGLSDRLEDIAPNLDYELERFSKINHRRIRMNAEARRQFIEFAQSKEARWSGNFRDLNAAVCRMATLSISGAITSEVVFGEIERLKRWWRRGEIKNGDLVSQFLGAQTKECDFFDRCQLEKVIEVCLSETSISEAGRILFQASRKRKKSSNDADRLVKYLARFGLSWEALHHA
jgi:transcriptional regulatory protein RtcR